MAGAIPPLILVIGSIIGASIVGTEAPEMVQKLPPTLPKAKPSAQFS